MVYNLRNSPKVFSFNIAWNIGEGQMSKAYHILKILSLIPNIFLAKDLFKTAKEDKHYFFKGMVCFSQMHYYSYFRDFESEKSSEAWYKYDDSRVYMIGDWELVLTHCF